MRERNVGSRDVSICACLCGFVCAKKSRFITKAFVALKLWGIEKHKNGYRQALIMKERLK